MAKKYTALCILVLSLFLLCSCRENAGNASGTTAENRIPDTGKQSSEEPSRALSPEEENRILFRDIQSCAEGVFTSFESQTVTYDFLQWASLKTGKNIFSSLKSSLAQGTYSSAFWHENTGMTLHVLKDCYSGEIVWKEAVLNNGKDSVSIGFAGDLCLSEGWSTLNFYDAHNQNLSEGIAGGIIEITGSFDIFTLNNEFTFSRRGAPLEGKYYTFRANPERIGILQELGTDVVSLSNNHCYDFGAEAFYDTLDTLTSAGIPYYGAGKNIDEARKPVFFVINGIKIGFVGANRSEKYIMTPEAGEDSPGVLRTYDSAMYLETIRNAKADCDYLVAYVHWGTEDSTVVTDYQKEMGREYIDAGADAVIGGHPHVLQGMEYYKGKLIAYSMGDFWFNDLHDDTGMLELAVNHTGTLYARFIPCVRRDGVTSLVTDKKEAKRIYSYMEDLSFRISINEQGIVSASS